MPTSIPQKISAQGAQVQLQLPALLPKVLHPLQGLCQAALAAPELPQQLLQLPEAARFSAIGGILGGFQLVMGVPLVIHFERWDFPYNKNHPAMGVPP